MKIYSSDADVDKVDEVNVNKELEENVNKELEELEDLLKKNKSNLEETAQLVQLTEVSEIKQNLEESYKKLKLFNDFLITIFNDNFSDEIAEKINKNEILSKINKDVKIDLISSIVEQAIGQDNKEKLILLINCKLCLEGNKILLENYLKEQLSTNTIKYYRGAKKDEFVQKMGILNKYLSISRDISVATQFAELSDDIKQFVLTTSETQTTENIPVIY